MEGKLKNKILFYAKASMSPQPGPIFLNSQADPTGEDGTVTPCPGPNPSLLEKNPAPSPGEDTQWEVARKLPTSF